MHWMAEISFCYCKPSLDLMCIMTGDANAVNIQALIKRVTEVTRCSQSQAELALHDYDNDVNAAIDYILERGTNVASWTQHKTKKDKKKGEDEKKPSRGGHFFHGPSSRGRGMPRGGGRGQSTAAPRQPVARAQLESGAPKSSNLKEVSSGSKISTIEPKRSEATPIPSSSTGTTAGIISKNSAGPISFAQVAAAAARKEQQRTQPPQQAQPPVIEAAPIETIQVPIPEPAPVETSNNNEGVENKERIIAEGVEFDSHIAPSEPVNCHFGYIEPPAVVEMPTPVPVVEPVSIPTELLANIQASTMHSVAVQTAAMKIVPEISSTALDNGDSVQPPPGFSTSKHIASSEPVNCHFGYLEPSAVVEMQTNHYPMQLNMHQQYSQMNPDSYNPYMMPTMGNTLPNTGIMQPGQMYRAQADDRKNYDKMSGVKAQSAQQPVYQQHHGQYNMGVQPPPGFSTASHIAPSESVNCHFGYLEPPAVVKVPTNHYPMQRNMHQQYNQMNPDSYNPYMMPTMGNTGIMQLGQMYRTQEDDRKNYDKMSGVKPQSAQQPVYQQHPGQYNMGGAASSKKGQYAWAPN